MSMILRSKRASTCAGRREAAGRRSAPRNQSGQRGYQPSTGRGRTKGGTELLVTRLPQLTFYNTLSRSEVGRGGSIENSFNSTSEFGEISMSRPLRGRPSDLKRGEGRGGARQYFKNVGEGGREGGRAASEHAPRWNVRYPISPMALPRETNDRARDRSPQMKLHLSRRVEAPSSCRQWPQSPAFLHLSTHRDARNSEKHIAYMSLVNSLP